MLTMGGLLSWFIVVAFRLRQSVGTLSFSLDFRQWPDLQEQGKGRSLWSQKQGKELSQMTVKNERSGISFFECIRDGI